MYPSIDKKETGIRIRNIMNSRNITVKDIQKYLGLACVQSVYHWLDGTCLPSIDNFYALSQLFGVPVDDMICGNRISLNNKKLDVRSRRLHEYYICSKAILIA